MNSEQRLEMWLGLALELEKENTILRARLEAVRARCEANNWMGTARLCVTGESELGNEVS